MTLKGGREQLNELIEVGEFLDTTEANKTTLKQPLERYEREVSSKKRTKQDPYLIKNICKYEFVDKVLSHISSSDIAEFRIISFQSLQKNHLH